MFRHGDDADPVPQFARPLAPYVKSRQDVLKIRRALTLYLRNQVAFSEQNAGSHLSLSTSYDVAGVKRIPKEITGLRKEYLKAVQEHAAAKNEFDELVQKAANDRKETAASTEKRLGNGQDLQTYKALLQARRRRDKLQIFHHYLEELDRKQAARPNYLNIHGDPKPSSAFENSDFQIDQGNGSNGANGENLEATIHNLEKAVIRAKHQLDSEKRLLENLKRTSEGDIHTASANVKVEALQRTRDELVGWVEEKLPSANSNEVEEIDTDEPPNISFSLQERKAEIKEHYEAYIEARKRLLELASMAPPQVPAIQRAESTPSDGTMAQTRASQDPSVLLPYANDILLPLYKAQKALGLQKSHISAIMAKEKSGLCRTLDRLNDESHLIPSYPILAKQPRFKHAVTAIKTRSLGSVSPEQSSIGEDEVVAHAQAWAFASEAARGNTRDFIEERITLGSEAADNAEGTLEELYDIMNQDHSETIHGQKESKEEESDIWTTDVKPGKGRGRSARSEKPRGPWSALSGKIGLG